MNIFVLDNNPALIPRHYCDLHVNKMLLESCQLLCSVYENGTAPYRRTHYNHPCSVWVRTSIQNFTWLEELANVLSIEYTNRRGRIHKCDDVLDWVANNTPELPDTQLTTHPLCMPDEHKTDTVVDSYRRYYAAKLRDFRNRGICKFTKSEA
jgi:hypothetical protein